MIDQNDLRNILKRIVVLYNPELIYLFGSYAKGTMTKNSDLDFIVVKRTSLQRYRRGRNVVGALAEFAVEIDILFLTSEELEMECKKPYSLLHIAMPSALLLYRRWPILETLNHENCDRTEHHDIDVYSSSMPP